jgi:hypothetical protein
VLHEQAGRAAGDRGLPGGLQQRPPGVVAEQAEGGGDGVRVQPGPGRGVDRVDALLEQGAGGVGHHVVGQLQREPHVDTPGAQRVGVLAHVLAGDRLDRLGLLAGVEQLRVERAQHRVAGEAAGAELVPAGLRGEGDHPQLLRPGQARVERPQHRVAQRHTLVGRGR